MLHDHVLECIASFLFLLGVWYTFMTRQAKQIQETPPAKRPEDYTVEDFMNIDVPPEDKEEMDRISKEMWEKIDGYRKALKN